MGRGENDEDRLFKVLKVVEVAESTIKLQAEENSRLKTELQIKIRELEKYNPNKLSSQHLSTEPWDDRDRFPRNDFSAILNHDPKRHIEDYSVQSPAESHSDFSRINGTVKGLSSFSSSRHQMEGEFEQRFHLSRYGQMPGDEHSISNLQKQTRENEEEISQLRRHLSDYSTKETQLHNENYLLEKRIGHMRMAFDEQQQYLVDAASKALIYCQDIIEESIRLTYALQAAQQDKTTFVSYLMPLLADYSLQPSVSDAQSIVSNLKVLFKHLQEQLILTEDKLKESQYQLAPWRSDLTSQNNRFELVTHPEYSHGNVPITFPSPQTPSDWEMLGNHQGVTGDQSGKTLELDEFINSPLANRNSAPQDLPKQQPAMYDDSQPAARYSEEAPLKQVTFKESVGTAELHYLDFDGRQHEREPSANWSSKSSPYSATSPYLPPVLEEPSSSVSEVGDDDPLPAIEGLQISGDAFPGRELLAAGYSVNGTTSCNFEWVRHLQDGSVNYIDGAKQPNYLITADDVDTYLAIEVQPLDDRNRKGELVRVFANENRKIICDPEMQNGLEKALYNGHASYSVSLSTGFLDIWERATLVVKREGYSIKRSGASGESIADKFLSTMSATISFEHAAEFTITGTGGDTHILRAENHQTDFSCSRDTIVLVLRLFIMRVHELNEDPFVQDMTAISNGETSSVSPSPYMINGSARGRKSGTLEKAMERRHRRMIKNWVSVARSRSGKQASTLELKAEVKKLKEMNTEL